MVVRSPPPHVAVTDEFRRAKYPPIPAATKTTTTAMTMMFRRLGSIPKPLRKAGVSTRSALI